MEITDISGENLAGWEKKESVGIGLYYEKDYCQKPLDLTVQLEKGKSRQTSVKLLNPEYGDYEYAQLAVRSGIWTLYYNAFYADCYALGTDDISVEGAVYYPYYDETNKTFSVGTTLWDTYPKVEVHVHGVVPTVEWFGEESGEQITSGALAGKLTLSRGEHKAEYGLRLGYSGQGDNALDKRIQVQSVSAEGISQTQEWTGNEQKTLRLYSQNGILPEKLTVTKTDGDTCDVDVLHEGDYEQWGYYMEVPGGIWKRKVEVEFKLESMDVWKVKSVTGTGVNGFTLERDGEDGRNNCNLYVYREGGDVPADLQITYAEGISFKEREGLDPTIGGVLHLGIFSTDLYIIYRNGTPPAASDESASEGSNLNGSAELDEDITDLLLTEEDPEQAQESSDLFADAEPEYDSVAPAGDDESIPVFIDETADDEIIAEESAEIWDGQEEGSW